MADDDLSGPASCRAEDPYVRDESGGEGGGAAEEEVRCGGGWGWEDGLLNGFGRWERSVVVSLSFKICVQLWQIV